MHTTKPGTKKVEPWNASAAYRAAHEFAQRGWPVFPLTGRDGPRSEATTNLARLQRWWRDNPSAGVGVATGPLSRLWVLSVGAQHQEALSRLELEHGPLPRTVTAMSGDDRRDLYFLWPAGQAALVPTRAASTDFPFRVAWADGFVAAPAGAADLVWDHSPSAFSLAEAPPWLLNKVLRGSRAATPPVPSSASDESPAGTMIVTITEPGSRDGTASPAAPDAASGATRPPDAAEEGRSGSGGPTRTTEKPGAVPPQPTEACGFEFHPLANLFPLMPSKALGELGADIRERGLDQPIWLFEGKILDGRNRALACEIVGSTPKFQSWEGVGSPVSFVVAANLSRRHLDESQRAMIAARLKPLYAQEARQRMLAGKAADPQADLPEGQTRDQLGKLLNVSGKLVDAGSKVLTKGVPGLIEAVENREVSISAAVELTELSADEQAEIIKGGPESANKKVKSLRDGKKARPKRAGRDEPSEPVTASQVDSLKHDDDAVPETAAGLASLLARRLGTTAARSFLEAAVKSLDDLELGAGADRPVDIASQAPTGSGGGAHSQLTVVRKDSRRIEGGGGPLSDQNKESASVNGNSRSTRQRARPSAARDNAQATEDETRPSGVGAHVADTDGGTARADGESSLAELNTVDATPGTRGGTTEFQGP